MKIDKFCIRFFPAIGGAENYIYQICENLYKRKFDIQIHTSDLAGHINFIRQKEKTEYKYTVNKYYSIKIPKKTYPIMPGMFRINLRETNIVHLYTVHYFPCLAGYYLAEKYKIPYALSPIFDFNRAKRFNFYTKNIIYKIFKNANMVFFLTEAEKKMCLESGISFKNYEIIPFPLDLDFINSVDSEEKNIEEKKIIFIGRLAYGKGIDILLKGFNRLQLERNDIKLDLVGKDFGMKKYIMEYIREKKIEHKVHIYEEFSREQVIAKLKASDLLVLPSRYEAYGIVVVEAFACGIPVLVSNIPSLIELTGKGERGYVFDLNNKKDFYEKLKKILSSKSDDEMLDKANEFALKLDEKKVVKRIINAYEKVF